MPEEEFEFPSVEGVIVLHASVIGKHPDEAPANVMNMGLLESAVNRPRQRFFYESADLPALAATLLWGVVNNHPFYDGNKRTAWVTTEYFLYQNGYILPPGGESIRLVLNIALGRRSVEEVEEWIRHRLEPAQQRRWFFNE